MNDRPLTEKEKLVVSEFESARPGLGVITERNIRNNDKTGWAEIIEDTPIEDLKLKTK